MEDFKEFTPMECVVFGIIVPAVFVIVAVVAGSIFY